MVGESASECTKQDAQQQKSRLTCNEGADAVKDLRGDHHGPARCEGLRRHVCKVSELAISSTLWLAVVMASTVRWAGSDSVVKYTLSPGAAVEEGKR